MYSPSGWQSYSIPVGSFYTGAFSKLFFAADNDGAANGNDSWFSNVTIHEGNCGPAALQPLRQPVTLQLGDEPEFAVSAYPNPFSDLVYLDVQGLEGTVQVEIFDAMGKKVWQDLNVTVGSRSSLKPEIARGIYVLRLSQGTFRRDIKLVKSQ
ncbi:MAG: T9SS type A sorting domain-containing protein [Bacteroidia bacterium]